MDMVKPLFKLILLKDAEVFMDNLPQKDRDKILFNIRKVRFGVKDVELFKKLGDTDIWEFRTSYNGKSYRLFSFWDKEEETLVIATHGMIKKTQKTPSADIVKAEKLRNEWFMNKKK